MKDTIIQYLISNLLASFLKTLNPEQLKVQLDNLIDSIEIHVQQTENPYDDNLLPVLRFCRDFFAIPDLPDS